MLLVWNLNSITLSFLLNGYFTNTADRCCVPTFSDREADSLQCEEEFGLSVVARNGNRLEVRLRLWWSY